MTLSPRTRRNDGCKLVTDGKPFRFELGIIAYMGLITGGTIGYIIWSTL